jgi:UPF0716 protein FxsA
MWILLGVLALPLVEIGLFVTLGAKLGLWLTLAWVMLTGVLGVFLMRRLSLGGTGLRQSLQEGIHHPLSPIMHRALVGVAAVLLILPGFFTDALGLLLLVRPVRSGLIALLARRFQGVTIIGQGFGPDARTYDDRPYDVPPSNDRLN